MDWFEFGDWETNREHWNVVGKQLGIQRRELPDEEVANIRERLPFGPPSPPFVLELARELHLFPISIFRIWVGATFKRRQAFPKEHPMRLNINADNALKQRERDKINKIDIVPIGQSQEWLCVYCETPLVGKYSPLTEGKNYQRDHIVPLSAGGLTVPENIQLVCAKCNHRKHAMPNEHFRVVLPRMERAEGERREWQEFTDCPCLYWGCPPDCQGCSTCKEHNDKEKDIHPYRILCPIVSDLRSEFGWDWDECGTPDICRTQRICQGMVQSSNEVSDTLKPNGTQF